MPGLLAAQCLLAALVAAEPLHDVLPPTLTTPAPDCLWQVPVLVLSYIPTRDGTTVDEAVAGWRGSVEALRERVTMLTVRTKFGLEQGSRFRAYLDADAKPSLGYRVVDSLTLLERLPAGPFKAGEAAFYPDYRAVLERFGIRRYVEQFGVKEVWLWGYHHGNIAPMESNMASPLSGDISNSYRQDDLPVLDLTYVLYNYNYTRDARCAIENHCHQLEAQLDYLAQRQDGSPRLFRELFVGIPELGRCGNCHCPPNTAKDYDVANPTTVLSDIADWRPDGNGERRPVNAETWLGCHYAWPDGRDRFDEWDGLYWLIFWMQSHPGRGNRIPHPQGWMTNWWTFTADWDGAYRAATGLWSTTPARK